MVLAKLAALRGRPKIARSPSRTAPLRFIAGTKWRMDQWLVRRSAQQKLPTCAIIDQRNDVRSIGMALCSNAPCVASPYSCCLVTIALLALSASLFYYRQSFRYFS
jgi:hypothetical protein